MPTMRGTALATLAILTMVAVARAQQCPANCLSCQRTRAKLKPGRAPLAVGDNADPQNAPLRTRCSGCQAGYAPSKNGRACGEFGRVLACYFCFVAPWGQVTVSMHRIESAWWTGRIVGSDPTWTNFPPATSASSGCAKAASHFTPHLLAPVPPSNLHRLRRGVRGLGQGRGVFEVRVWIRRAAGPPRLASGARRFVCVKDARLTTPGPRPDQAH
jgi:hypothetical protein